MNPSTLLKFLAAVVLVYVCYCAFLFVVQRRILFQRPPVEAHPLALDVPRLEKMWLDTSVGDVEAWFLPPENTTAPAPALIYAHGNASLIDFWPESFHTLARRGIGALLVEYPGYGRSQGDPSQENIAATFTTAYDHLAARPDVDPTRIVLLGRSLGGGAVCTLAAQRPTAALVLVSTFTSIGSMARTRYFAPASLVRDPFDNLSAVRNYPNPILIAHGTDDFLVPFSHAQTLHQSAPHSTLWTYPAAHNNCPPHWPTFLDKVANFLYQSDIL